MAQVLQDIADMAIDFERSHGYSLLTFKVQYVSASNSSNLTGPASHLQKGCNNHQHKQINLNVGIVKRIT